MKKTLTSIISIITCIASIHAQTLYGTTSHGGGDGGGTINKFIPATNNLTIAKSFEGLASNPLADFIQASDGKLYSMTYGGGSSGGGVIFSFDPSSSTYTKLKDFDGTNGATPWGSLMQASDGKLYGVTYSGGSSGSGVIFSFDPTSLTYAKLKDFDNTNGGQPFGSLIQASDGKLYGMTGYGGSSGAGVIFSFDPSSATYTRLKDFDDTNGAHPEGSLIQASDGKLYGMTYQGGSSNIGVIFSFDPSTTNYTKLKDFDYTNGSNPLGSLMQASDGKLYGMTAGGSSNAGVIFSFDPSASTFAKLKDFDITNGATPTGSLKQASDGKLYGMTYGGGSSDGGVIFSFDPSGSTYIKLKDFDKTKGGYPRGSLIQQSDGKLYGMTAWGGSSNNGVIFSFDPSTSTYTLFKDFGINESGSNVSSSLIQASDGKLYGMTVNGGSSGAGVIFSFDPVSSGFKKLIDFNKADGAGPNGTMIQASDGKLYGMTSGGGSHNAGVIFSFDPTSSTYAKLMNFKNTIGARPSGNMIQASDGKLYGMTSRGGIGYHGVIFSFDPTSATYTKLKDFDGTDGAAPYGSMIQASDGKLYGMTNAGGVGFGVIFSFDPSSSTYTKLKDFDGTNGANPLGSLMQASDGKLYGMTYQGGSSDGGVIFSFDPASSTLTKLKDFDYYYSFYPLGSLMQASDGKLYGITYYGGGNVYKGVIFSFDPSSLTYTKLRDYNNANGGLSLYGSAFIEVKDNQNTAPAVSITAPTDNATYLAPAAHIKLSAAASDSDGTVTKVELYNGSALLDSVTTAPYDYVWENVSLGNYTLTAKAYDNSGNVTTSAPVHISVVPNKPPVVSIIKPENNQSFAAPAYIHFEAAASDSDGRITRVEFYNGSALLRTEYKYPYTYVWKGVPVGTYTITAVATDNWGAQTTSAPVTVRVKTAKTIVSNRPSSERDKSTLNDALSIRVTPNPATNIVTIYTGGLQQDKPATLSIISVSGIVLKTIHIKGSAQTVPLDISSLGSGVYTIKMISGEKVLYKQFVKL